jgi:ferric-dicitrate binding protein FerR (iron transport regulator)
MDIRTGDLICKYLAGALDESGRRQLERWLDADERHRRLLDELRDGNLWRDRGHLLSQIDMARAMRRFDARMGRPRGRRRATIGLRWAAVLVPAIAVAGFFLWRSGPAGDRIPRDIMPGTSRASLTTDGETIALEGGRQRSIAVSPSQSVYYDGRGIAYDTPRGDEGDVRHNRLSTPRGGEFVVALADGTRVWLNAATTLEYPSSFGAESREVTLSGEAFFEVASDGRPFRVRTGDATVEVLGTSFGVTCYAGGAATSAVLETGSIVFAGGGGEVRLGPGERAELLDGGAIDVRRVDVRYHTAWRHGSFYFDNQPLREIMATLSRWYDVDFTFADRSLETICFSGVALRSKPCDYVLRLLEQTHTVRFSRGGTGTILVEKV